MKETAHAPPWPRPEASVVAVGLFDGVHRGHRSLLKELVRWAGRRSAASVVVTFQPHPEAILHGSAPPLVVSPSHRVRLLTALGVDRVWLLTLDAAVLGLRAERFLETYVCRPLAAVGLLVGFDNRLGADQADHRALRALGPALGLEVRRCPPLLVGGVPVSSTAVRQAIAGGDLAEAERLLGRRVSIAGRVVEGAGRGRRLGYPTANLRMAHGAIVPCGVYAGEVTVDERRFPAAVSIGACPTFAGAGAAPAAGAFEAGRHVVEVHILDFDGDLLGTELEVELTERLRDEKTFPSPAALAAQLERDMAAIRARGLGGRD